MKSICNPSEILRVCVKAIVKNEVEALLLIWYLMTYVCFLCSAVTGTIRLNGTNLCIWPQNGELFPVASTPVTYTSNCSSAAAHFSMTPFGSLVNESYCLCDIFERIQRCWVNPIMPAFSDNAMVWLQVVMKCSGLLTQVVFCEMRSLFVPGTLVFKDTSSLPAVVS